MRYSFRQSPLSGFICKALVVGFGMALSVPSFATDPIYQSLVLNGVKVADSKHIPLTAPSLVDGMSAEEQQTVVQGLADEVGMDRFMKNSAVSPFVMEIKSAEKLEDASDVQRLDVWFVVYGSLDSVLDKPLFEDLAVPMKPTGDGPTDESRELTPAEMEKYHLKSGELADGSRATFGYIGMSLFDKVRLSLVTHAQSFRSPESVVSVYRIQDGIQEFPSTWSPITMDEDDKVRLGNPAPYTMAASFAKITELKFEPNALLIEIHVLYVEPQEWFNGRNLLRSKLPPIIQDGLRKFRRKLAQ
jgi:hypothetical protein